MKKPNYKNSANGIIGFAVGDAFGVPYEAKTRAYMNTLSNIKEMIGYGTYNLPEGTWSDDTSMTLATMDSIIQLGKIDTEDIADKFLKWFRKNEYTAIGRTFDIGRTTLQALAKYEFRLDKASNCGQTGEMDNGNGSLMRMLPIAYYIYYKGIKNGRIEDLHYNQLNSSGYIVDTLECVLWLFLNSNNYNQTIIRAVSLGGDTDTIAACAGGLVGIYYGIESIDEDWKKHLKRYDESIGGVLFVDEAYSIASYIQDEGGRDYGAECIATLLKGMEDHRDNLCVILAGYSKEMQHMLSVNPGFESRIQFVIDFPDYTSEELYVIFKQLCKKENYKISPNIKKILIQHFDCAKKSENFSNARYVRSLFEKIKIEHANRVIKEYDNKDLIRATDIISVIEKIKFEEKKNNRIGFVA